MTTADVTAQTTAKFELTARIAAVDAEIADHCGRMVFWGEVVAGAIKAGETDWQSGCLTAFRMKHDAAKSLVAEVVAYRAQLVAELRSMGR